MNKQLKRKKAYNKMAVNLSELKEGKPDIVRDYHSHKRGWKEARVVKQLLRRSYSVDLEGELLHRNRRDLKPTNSENAPVQNTDNPVILESSDVLAAPNPTHIDSTPVPIGGSAQARASGRIRQEPVWLKDYV